ncbi:MAG: UDP-N-acetylmuramate dehydrogenase [Chlamydiales bacterium]|nr:UDP-N-acetylmuramate dehydrogenase [Chlamydiales bacterium]
MTQQKLPHQQLKAKAISFQKNKPLCELSTIGVGGVARYFVEVHTIEEMRQALLLCRENEWKYLIIGKGSNCLFDDRGYQGAVILNKIDFIEELDDGRFHVGAGFNFSLLGARTARKGWAGLEFASGIPGSVGGAVFMNAGANGSETCDALESVDFLDELGRLETIPREQLRFAYRYSPFHERSGAIVGATFTLQHAQEARSRQIEIITYRKKTQPYGEKSAGCIFRNPDCGHAGALIEKSGLKGLRIGGAEVSDMHANFIVNTQGATAEDVKQLIDAVRREVKEKTGVDLESEVRVIPYE